MTRRFLLALFGMILISGLVLADSADNFDSVAFNKKAIVYLSEEQTFMSALASKTSDEVKTVYGIFPVVYDTDISKLDLHFMDVGLRGIVACAKSVDGNPDAVANLWRDMAEAAGNQKLDCPNADATPLSLLSGHGLAKVSKLTVAEMQNSENPDNFNPVLSALIQTYNSRLSIDDDVLEERVANTILFTARKRQRLGEAIAIDFPRLINHFSQDPKLNPYIVAHSLSEDDKKGLHLLEYCVESNYPLGTIYSYAGRDEFPPDEFFTKPACYWLGAKQSGDDKFVEVKKNYVALTKAIFGGNPLLVNPKTQASYANSLTYFGKNTRNLDKTKYVCKDRPGTSSSSAQLDPEALSSLIFACPDGITQCKIGQVCDPSLTFDIYKDFESARTEAKDAILEADKFVNTQYANLEHDMFIRLELQGSSTQGNFKDLKELSLSQRLVTAYLLETRFYQDNWQRFQTQKDYLCLGTGDCGTDIGKGCAAGFLQGTAMGEALNIGKGAAAFLPGPYRVVAVWGLNAVQAYFLVTTLRDAASLSYDFVKDYHSITQNHEKLTSACMFAAMAFDMGVTHTLHKVLDTAETEGRKFSQNDPDPAAVQEKTPADFTPDSGTVPETSTPVQSETPAQRQTTEVQDVTVESKPAEVAQTWADLTKESEQPPTSASSDAEVVSKAGALSWKRALIQKGVDLTAPLVSRYTKIVGDVSQKVKDAKLAFELSGPKDPKWVTLQEHYAALKVLEENVKDQAVVDTFKSKLTDPYTVLILGPEGFRIIRLNDPDVLGYPKKTTEQIKAWVDSTDQMNLKFNGETLTDVEILKPFVDANAKPELADFDRLRSLLHADIQADASTHTAAILDEFRQRAKTALLENAPDSLKSVYESGFKAIDDPAAFDQVRQDFKKAREQLNQVNDKGELLNDWEETRALRTVAAMDPALPKTLDVFGKDSDVFYMSSISPEGYARDAKSRLDGLTGDDLKAEKKKIAQETQDVKEGRMAFFGLGKLPRVSDPVSGAPGKPVLAKPEVDFLKKYSRLDEATQKTFEDVNAHLLDDLAKAREAYTGKGWDGKPQILGSGSERTAFLISAGKAGGKEVPAVIKAGTELQLDEALPASISKAHDVLTQDCSDPAKMKANLESKGFTPDADGLRAISAKIFHDYVPEKSKFSVQIQEYTEGKTAQQMRSDSSYDSLLEKAAFSEGESAGFRMTNTAELGKTGEIDKVTGVMDRENNENFNKDDLSTKSFDISKGQLTELPPEVALMYEMLQHDFAFGLKASAHVKSFLDGVKSAFEKSMGKEKGGAEFKRILEKALEKSKQYEDQPALSYADFYPNDVTKGYGHTILTSLLGTFDRDVIDANIHDADGSYVKSNNIEAEGNVYARNREQLETYTGEKAPDTSNKYSDIKADSIHPYTGVADFLTNANDPQAGKLLAIVNKYPDQMNTFVDKFGTLNKDSKTIDVSLLFLFRELAKQEETNIVQYISHGADHGIRVMDISLNLVDQWPGLHDAIEKKYGLDAKQAEAVAAMVGVIHDTGYSRLEVGHDKTEHSHHSGEIAQEFFDAHPDLFPDNGLRERLIKDMHDAIEQHNWNSNDAKYAAGIKTSDGRGYVPEDYSNPLLFTVQLADNLDFSHDRLYEYQGKEWFMDALHDMHTDSDLKSLTDEIKNTKNSIRELKGAQKGLTGDELLHNKDAIETSKAKLADLLNTKQNRVSDLFDNTMLKWKTKLSASDVNQMKEARKKIFGSDVEDKNIIDSGSFLHFMGTWAIRDLKFTTDTSGHFLVTFNLAYPESFKTAPGSYFQHIVGMSNWMPNMRFDGVKVSDAMRFRVDNLPGGPWEFSSEELRASPNSKFEYQTDPVDYLGSTCENKCDVPDLASTNPIDQAIDTPNVREPAQTQKGQVNIASGSSTDVTAQVRNFVIEKNQVRTDFPNKLTGVDSDSSPVIKVDDLSAGQAGIDAAKSRTFDMVDRTLSDLADKEGWWRQSTTDTVSKVMKTIASLTIDANGIDSSGNPNVGSIADIARLIKKATIALSYEDHMSSGQIFSDHSVFHYFEDFAKLRDGYPDATSKELALAGFTAIMHDYGYTLKAVDNHALEWKISSDHPYYSYFALKTGDLAPILKDMRSVFSPSDVDNFLYAVSSHGSKVDKSFYSKVPKTEPVIGPDGKPVLGPDGNPVLKPVLGPDGKPVLVDMDLKDKVLALGYGPDELSDPKSRWVSLFALADDLAAQKVPEIAELTWQQLLKLSKLKERFVDKDGNDIPSGTPGGRRINTPEGDAIRDDMRKIILGVQDQYTPRTVKQMLIAVENLGPDNFASLVSPVAIKETRFSFDPATHSAHVTVEMSKPFVDVLSGFGVDRTKVYTQANKIALDFFIRSDLKSYIDAVNSGNKDAYEQNLKNIISAQMNNLDASGQVEIRFNGNTITIKNVNSVSDKYQVLFEDMKNRGP